MSISSPNSGLCWIKSAVSGLIGAALLSLSACATNETDPAKVSMYDLWFGQDRLEQHLVDKRRELDELVAKTELIYQRIRAKSKKLAALESSIAEETASGDELFDRKNEMLLAVSQQEKQLVAHRASLKTLNEQLVSTQELLVNMADPAEVQVEISRYEKEISDLENNIALQERAIDRILIARAKHELETE